jgi:selenide,water dikinase
MAELNRHAAEIMARYPVHACTDITGFGLLGHLAEMVDGSGLGVRVRTERVPLIPQTLEYAGMGLLPGGAYKNKEFRARMVDFSPTVDNVLQDILFDPQTSGGLLICLGAENAIALLKDLRQRGVRDAAVIGEVVREPAERISVT